MSRKGRKLCTLFSVQLPSSSPIICYDIDYLLQSLWSEYHLHRVLPSSIKVKCLLPLLQREKMGCHPLGWKLTAVNPLNDCGKTVGREMGSQQIQLFCISDNRPVYGLSLIHIFLPAPFSPQIQCTSPLLRVMFTASSATTPGKIFVIFLALRISIFSSFQKAYSEAVFLAIAIQSSTLS